MQWLSETVNTQLMFRTANGRLGDQISVESEPEPVLDPQESILYSILSLGEGKTVPELSEIMGIDRSRVYHLLDSLQEKKLVKAITGKSIKFIAIK